VGQNCGVPEWTFDALVDDVAARKRRAADARFGKATPQPGVPTPREVFLSVCGEIAEHYIPLGFRYAPSGPRLTRKPSGSEFTHRLSFYSSHYNVAGEPVVVDVYAGVSSTRFKKWQADNPLGGLNPEPDDMVISGNLGNLQTDPQFLKWDVPASGEDRATAVADIIAHIDRIGLPFFTAFDDPAGVAAHIEATGAWPCKTTLTNQARILLYLTGSTESVTSMVRHFLDANQLWDAYSEAVHALADGTAQGNAWPVQAARIASQIGVELGAGDRRAER